MSTGWYFTGESGTERRTNSDGGTLFMSFKEMSDETLSNLLRQLLTGGPWRPQIKAIQREIDARSPTEVIATVTVKGKLG